MEELKKQLSEYKKELLLLLIFPLIYGGYLLAQKMGVIVSEEYKQFEIDYKKQVLEYGRMTSMASGVVWERSKRIAEFLGTHKNGTSNSEDEESVVNIILSIGSANDDFFFLEGTYKAYHTEQRNLVADLMSLLSGSQFASISHLFSGTKGTYASNSSDINNVNYLNALEQTDFAPVDDFELGQPTS